MLTSNEEQRASLELRIEVSGPAQGAERSSTKVHLEPASSCIRSDEARETLKLSVVHEVLRFELSCLRDRALVWFQ